MFVPCDNQALIAQIGTGTILATSGGRIVGRETGISLPVRYGYGVTVDLAADDTYTVSRTFTRSGRVTVKGTRTDVHCEEVGEAVYRAGCYHDEF